MMGIDPASKLASKLRQLRRRFGITAPQVAVRPHFPWYLRLLVVIGLVLAMVLLARLVFDTGRKVAGFDQGEASHVVEELRAANARLEEELARASSLLSASESNLKIEQSAQRLLAEQNNALVAENARLKEEIAVFERLVQVAPANEGGVSLDKLSVRPVAPGTYGYSFLIALQGKRRGKEASFDLQLVISVAGGGANIILPANKTEQEGDPYRIILKNFRRIEGKFKLPDGLKPANIEFRILENGKSLIGKSVSIQESADVRQ